MKHHFETTLIKKYPRVFLSFDMEHIKPLSKIQIQWHQKIQSPVFDLTENTMCLYQPARLGLNLCRGDRLQLQCWINRPENIKSLNAVIISSSNRLLTIDWSIDGTNKNNELRDQVCRAFDLEEIAKSMQRVHGSKIYDEQTFDLWLHGPMNTNLLIWRDRVGNLKNVRLELQGQVYDWNSGIFRTGPSRNFLSYATEDYTYYITHLVPLIEVSSNSDDALHFRYFVSKIMDMVPVMHQVSAALSSHSS